MDMTRQLDNRVGTRVGLVFDRKFIFHNYCDSFKYKNKLKLKGLSRI